MDGRQEPEAQAAARHPLDPLTDAELRAAVAAVRADQPELDRPAFPVVVLHDPPKRVVIDFVPGDPIRRTARLVVLERGTGRTFEATVALEEARVTSWQNVPGVQPPIMLDEFKLAQEAALADPRFIAALRRRGIEDPRQVQVDPLSAGHYPHNPSGRRILWATPYLRPNPTDNGYARPIENLRACVDLLSGEVLDVFDGEVVPIPTCGGNYDQAAVGVRDDIKALDIVQPDGPSFAVDGHEISGQRWRLHVSLHPIDGLVLHHVRYEDGGRERQVLYRASLSEMVVPYGDPHAGYFWRNYFDAGEYGLGKTTNSLRLGCDCLGEIHYFDAVVGDAEGEPVTIENAICLHEEDFGLLWKHYDTVADRVEVRRSRRLVVSAIATLGNYDYAFYWYLYQDGAIEFEIKMTGIVLTRAMAPQETSRHAQLVAPGLAASHHQHLFNVRLDMAVDGFDNSVYEVDMVASDPGEANPHGAATELRETPIRSEREARREIDPLKGRHWKVVNEGRRNALGEPVGYKLIPHSGPVLLAHPDSSIGRRAGFAQAHLWVTHFAEHELHAGGEYPNQHAGGEGLPAWVRQDRGLADADVVLWHTLGASHAVRTEDWPVMPVDRIGFVLKPVGFFDRNPGIDVPPASPGCHRAEPA